MSLYSTPYLIQYPVILVIILSNIVAVWCENTGMCDATSDASGVV